MEKPRDYFSQDMMLFLDLVFKANGLLSNLIEKILFSFLKFENQFISKRFDFLLKFQYLVFQFRMFVHNAPEK